MPRKKRWGNFSSPSRKARQGKPRKKWFGWSTLEVMDEESRKEKSSPAFLSSRFRLVRNLRLPGLDWVPRLFFGNGLGTFLQFVHRVDAASSPRFLAFYRTRRGRRVYKSAQSISPEVRKYEPRALTTKTMHLISYIV